MQLSEYIHIELPVKSYVKKYLENMLGKNLILSDNPLISLIVAPYFKIISTRYDKRINLDSYPSIIQLKVSLDFALRQGTALSKTQIFSINKAIEKLIKHEITIYYSLCKMKRATNSKASIIRYYQQDFGFDESDFSSDAIDQFLKRSVKKTYGANVPIYQQIVVQNNNNL